MARERDNEQNAFISLECLPRLGVTEDRMFCQKQSEFMRVKIITAGKWEEVGWDLMQLRHPCPGGR